MAEEKKDKGTIWQRLTKVINSDTYGEPDVTSTNDQSVQTPQNNEKELLTATSVEELNIKKLEAQQNKYLKDQYQKVTNNLYQQSVFYETTRLGTYMDVEACEYYPAIATALDIFAEEATVPGADGNSLHITSDSPRVKKILQNLFYNTLDINTNLPAWTRNTAKYGDNFVFLKTDKTKGVINCAQLPNIEITRKEGDMFGEDSDTKTALVRFLWQNRNIEFNSWQIAHFRMIGDDRRLPYGTSILEKARKVFKQLCLDENTIIWTTTGYKKIKDVTTDDTIYSYDFNKNKVVESKVKNCIKTGIKKTYKVRSVFNEISVTEEHPILVYNIKDEKFYYKTVNELKTNVNKNKDMLVAPAICDGGIDSFTIKMNPKDYHIILNEKGKEHCKTLNRVGIIKKIKENISPKNFKNTHLFIQGDKDRRIRYDYLEKLNETFGITKDMVDVYLTHTKEKSLVNKDLEYIIDKEFIKFFGFMLGDGWTRKKSNTVSFALGEYEEQNNYYIDYIKKTFNRNYSISTSKHSQLSKSLNIYCKELYLIFEKLGFITGFANKVIPSWAFSLTKESKFNLVRGLFDADGSDGYNTIGLANERLINDFKQLSTQVGIPSTKIKKVNGSTKIENGKTITRQDSFFLYSNFKKITDLRYSNILSIEEETEKNVWDIEVDNDLHNFIANGLVVHNCLLEDAASIYRISRAPERRVFKIDVGNIDDKDVDAYVQRIAAKFKKTPQLNNSATGAVDLRYNSLSVDQDFFIPVRNGNSQTVIDTLQGASNLDQIKDMEYFQNNLLTALRVPKAFLGFAEAAGDGKNLAMQDVRFARTVNRVQQCMIQELNKIAIIHLFMLGLEDELNNFTLSLTNPSTQAETLKIEQLNAKLDAYTKAVTTVEGSFAPMSLTKAKKEILGMSDAEIILDLQQQRLEKAAAIENQEENVAGKITTGIFKNLDARYSIGANPEEVKSPSENPAGDELGNITPPEIGNIPTPEAGAENAPETAPEAPTVAENKYSIEDEGAIILSENVKKMLDGINKLLKDDDKKPL